MQICSYSSVTPSKIHHCSQVRVGSAWLHHLVSACFSFLTHHCGLFILQVPRTPSVKQTSKRVWIKLLNCSFFPECIVCPPPISTEENLPSPSKINSIISPFYKSFSGFLTEFSAASWVFPLYLLSSIMKQLFPLCKITPTKILTRYLSHQFLINILMPPNITS